MTRHTPTADNDVIATAWGPVAALDRCTVCGAAEDDLFGHRWLLGTDDRLCFKCFCLWHDGITDRAEMRRRRLEGPP